LQHNLAVSWSDHRVALSVCFLAFIGCALGITWFARRDDAGDGIGFVLALAMMLSAVAALGLSFFPHIVPFRITLWEAASATASHEFLLVGALIATPVILAYTAFAYRVFRGKTPADGWY
jgi:cytochrome d ubiquinol oxidase subunit II